MDCLEASKRGLAPEFSQAPLIDAGFDIADAGADKNVLAIRRGPTVHFLDTWKTKTPGFFAPSAGRVAEHCLDHNVGKLYFDAGGLGAPMRGELVRLQISFALEGINFGE